MLRLELCAALTGAQLSRLLEREVSLPISRTNLWTMVLSWLHSESCQFKVFIGTQVAEIQELTDRLSWQYLDSAKNPADDQTRAQVKRPDSPLPSCVSMKSDASMDVPLRFKDGEFSPGNSVTQVKRPDSALSSCVSMKSDASMDVPLRFKDGEFSPGNSVMQMDGNRIETITDPGCKTSSAGTDVQEKYKLNLMKKFQHVNDVITNQRNPTLLNEIYTELYITEGDSGKVNNEHEEIKETNISSLHKILFIFDGLDECRFPLDFQNTVRVCDVTKSASVNVLLINLIKGNLLPSALIWITSRPAAADQIPSEWINRVTEVRGFNDPQKEEYFRKRISDQILSNRIITHLKSLRSLYIMCHIPVFCWISATVLERMLGEAESGEIPKTLTQMYTHFLIIQTNIIKKKYTASRKTDKEMVLKLGKLAFRQLMKGNLIFYEEDLMECGIDVTEASVYSGVCTQIFREEFGLHQSKVYCFVHLSIQEHLAALYAHMKFMNKKRNVFKKPTTNILRLKVKFSDVYKSAVVLALQSENGHLELFLRFLLGLSLESNQIILQTIVRSRGSSFHSNQETVHYIKEKIRENPSTEKSINLFHCLNELEDHSLIEEIQHYLQSGNLQQIELSSSQWSAVVFMLLTSVQEQDVFVLNKYMNKHCTSDKILLKLLPVVAASRKAEFNDCGLNEESCVVLASVLSSESSNLRELDLSRNKLRDSGVKSLSAGLENPHCKLETLRLCYCGVTDEGCAALTSALRSNPSHLRELDLSRNKLGDSGVKSLSAGLENPHCKLETLRLCYCGVSDEGCAALTSALRSNPSHLRQLDLSGNKLRDSRVKSLSAVLENPHCKLETLRLQYPNCLFVKIISAQQVADLITSGVLEEENNTDLEEEAVYEEEDGVEYQRMIPHLQMLKRKTMVGTVRKNKPVLTHALLATRGRKAFSSKFAFTPTTTLVSFLRKKNKNVVLLSTLHKTADISDHEDKTPAIILDYNHNKGGVDNIDKCQAFGV
ncbi:hypothetical protein QTP70_008898 [Hemibagrus guttatus]|uniref:FISNA domain-containing protein n=1 Tax=Hemibagrus guttatus TaxID=175788 RepID=A0AAE0UM86_9TELE|nr:hypothetical protein QTP70_008898 [Hemibagrus guttatus]